MPYNAGTRLPGERASRLGHLVHRFQNNITMTQSPQAFHPSYISI